tara:strand:+ start:3842 stop:4117 length:276 start_codon:yes stop_codon:yes gene_type:complete
MKKVIKLKESDIENLVKRIIKEDESRPMGSAELKKATKDSAKTMAGLSGDDKKAYEGLLQLAEKLKEPGNQITGKFKMRLFQLFKEAGVQI